MRQLIHERLRGHAEIVGEGSTADEATAAAAAIEPDVVVLDYRTAVGNIEGSVAAIKESRSRSRTRAGSTRPRTSRST
jgi:chemotaxis response regulator CheB